MYLIPEQLLKETLRQKGLDQHHQGFWSWIPGSALHAFRLLYSHLLPRVVQLHFLPSQDIGCLGSEDFMPTSGGPEAVTHNSHGTAISF